MSQVCGLMLRDVCAPASPLPSGDLSRVTRRQRGRGIATYHLAHFVFADPVRHRRRTLKYVSLPSIRAYKLHPNAEVAARVTISMSIDQRTKHGNTAVINCQVFGGIYTIK